MQRQAAPPTTESSPEPSPEMMIKAAALAEVQCTIQRRILQRLSLVQGRRHCAREVNWCLVEAIHAAFSGRRLTHKDLTALAGGVISASSLSRAIEHAEERGLIRRVPDPEDARAQLLLPGPVAMANFLALAPSGYALIDDTIERARSRLAARPPRD